MLSLAGVAQAGVVVGNLSVEWDVVHGLTVGTEAVDVYTLRFRSMVEPTSPAYVASLFAGFEGQIVPDAGSRIFTQTAPGGALTPSLNKAYLLTPGQFQVDTHFNVLSADYTPVIGQDGLGDDIYGPTQFMQIGNVNVLSEFAGTGPAYGDSRLSGFFDIRAEYRSGNFSYARIVVSAGKAARLQGFFTNGQVGRVGGYNDILIPEPASLSVLALGAIAMLIRHRRA